MKQEVFLTYNWRTFSITYDRVKVPIKKNKSAPKCSSRQPGANTLSAGCRKYVESIQAEKIGQSKKYQSFIDRSKPKQRRKIKGDRSHMRQSASTLAQEKQGAARDLRRIREMESPRKTPVVQSNHHEERPLIHQRSSAIIDSSQSPNKNISRSKCPQHKQLPQKELPSRQITLNINCSNKNSQQKPDIVQAQISYSKPTQNSNNMFERRSRQEEEKQQAQKLSKQIFGWDICQNLWPRSLCISLAKYPSNRFLMDADIYQLSAFCKLITATSKNPFDNDSFKGCGLTKCPEDSITYQLPETDQMNKNKTIQKTKKEAFDILLNLYNTLDIRTSEQILKRFQQYGRPIMRKVEVTVQEQQARLQKEKAQSHRLSVILSFLEQIWKEKNEKKASTPKVQVKINIF